MTAHHREGNHKPSSTHQAQLDHYPIPPDQSAFQLVWMPGNNQDTPRPVKVTVDFSVTLGDCSATAFDDVSFARNEIWGGFVDRYNDQGDDGFFYENEAMFQDTDPGSTETPSPFKTFRGAQRVIGGVNIAASTSAVAFGGDPPRRSATVTAGAASGQSTALHFVVQ